MQVYMLRNDCTTIYDHTMSMDNNTLFAHIDYHDSEKM